MLPPRSQRVSRLSNAPGASDLAKLQKKTVQISQKISTVKIMVKSVPHPELSPLDWPGPRVTAGEFARGNSRGRARQGKGPSTATRLYWSKAKSNARNRSSIVERKSRW